MTASFSQMTGHAAIAALPRPVFVEKKSSRLAIESQEAAIWSNTSVVLCRNVLVCHTIAQFIHFVPRSFSHAFACFIYRPPWRSCFWSPTQWLSAQSDKKQNDHPESIVGQWEVDVEKTKEFS